MKKNHCLHTVLVVVVFAGRSSLHSVEFKLVESLPVEFTIATKATLRFTRKQYTLKNPKKAQKARACLLPKPAKKARNPRTKKLQKISLVAMTFELLSTSCDGT